MSPEPALVSEAIDDRIYIVLALDIQLGRGVQLHKLPVNAYPNETLGVQLGEKPLVLPLAIGNHRGQEHELLPLRQG